MHVRGNVRLCVIFLICSCHSFYLSKTDGKQGVNFYTQIKTITSNWQYAGADLGGATMPVLGNKNEVR